ncbi:MAG: ATP-binding protein [Erysipelotrichaceae bacterium]
MVWYRTTAEIMKNPLNEDVEVIIYAINISDEKNLQTLVKGVVAMEFDFITQVNANTGTYSMYLQNSDNLEDPFITGDYFYEDNVEFIKRHIVDEDVETSLRESKIDFMLERLDREGDYYTYYKTKSEDGSLRQKKVHVFYSDKSARLICIARTDITNDILEQQKKNDMLKEAVDLAEKASKAKTDFLSRMSHDIRTPMNAIIGMTALSKLDIDNKDKTKENLEIIDSSGKLLLNMINDLLDMAKVESGSMDSVKEVFDFDLEYKNVVELTSVIMIQKQQIFEKSKQLTNRYYIGDITRLKRVMINLLSNASKFTPIGGTIKIEVSEEMTNDPRKVVVVTKIIDSGIGIEEDKISTIFEPFMQLDTDYINLGTGLGLSIVRSIVQANDGTINVESVVGKGSIFTVSIPMEIANDQKVGVVDNNPKVDLHGYHILLVEDHPVNTLVASRLLEKYGAKVETAEDGIKGYEKFIDSEVGHYNLIFMDIQMPRMNGYETTKAIRSSDHLQAKTIPIIAMTANAYPEDIQKSLESGMNEHIAKPISIDRINRALIQVIEQSLNMGE